MGTRQIVILVTALVVSGCAVLPQSPSVESTMRYRTLIERGERSLDEGRLDEAQAAYALALEIAELPEAIEGVGCVLFRRGDIEGAKRAFEEALRRDPEYASAIGNLALAYEVQNEDSMAQSLYHRALALEPTNAAVRNNYAALLAKRGGREDLRSAYFELRAAEAVVSHPIIEGNLKEASESL